MPKIIWQKGEYFKWGEGGYGVALGRRKSLLVVPMENNRALRIIRKSVPQDATLLSGEIAFEIRVALVAANIASNIKGFSSSQDVTRNNKETVA